MLALRDSIPDDMAKLTALRDRHVLSARHFSRELLQQLFRLAAGFESGQVSSSARLSGRILINAFLASSNTGTQFAFETECSLSCIRERVSPRLVATSTIRHTMVISRKPGGRSI